MSYLRLFISRPFRWAGFALLATGMAVVAPAQVILVANNGGDTIGQFGPTGSSLGPLATGVSMPNGLALDAAGNVYVAAAGTTSINEYSPAGVSRGTFASTGLNNPMGLAFDTAGNLYVANFGSNSVERFSPTGTDLGVFASANLNGPDALAFDRSGNLYVTNYFSGNLWEFSSSGLPMTSAFASVYTPGSMALDAAGNFYVSDQGNNVIEKLSPVGRDLGVFATTGEHNAIGLVFDASGNLYAAYRDANTIEKFSAAGADLGVFANTGLNTPTFLALAPVPEPATWLMLLAGGGVVLGLRRRSGDAAALPRR